MSDSLRPHGLQHARLPCSLSPGVCSNSCPLNQWSYLTISFPAAPFSFCLLSQHQGLFQRVVSSHQVAKVLKRQHQSFQWIFKIDFLSDCLVGSPCSPRDSQEFSPAPVWKHQFFGIQPSLWSNSHIHTWLLEKLKLWLQGSLLAKWCLCFLIHHV